MLRPRMSDGTGSHTPLPTQIEDALVAALETADPASRAAAIDALCARHPDLEELEQALPR